MKEFKKIILKNGVTLYFCKDENTKQTYADYGVKYGSSGKWFDFNYDGVDYHVLPGVAHFLEHMLGEHSKFGNIYKNFALRNHKKNGRTSQNATNYFFMGTEEVKESIKELIEAVDLPIFTREDVEKTREAIISESRTSSDKVERTYRFYGLRSLYGDVEGIHESYSAIGNPETTKLLDYDTLKLCYDAFYYDENKVLVIIGNYEEQELVDYLESIYVNIPRHEKKVKFKDFDLEPIRNEYEVINKAVSTPVNIVSFKTNNTKYFSPIEKEIFCDIFCSILFTKKAVFINELVNREIIDNFQNCYTMNFMGDCIYNLVLSTNDIEKTRDIILDVMKNPNISEEEFEIKKRSFIGQEAKSNDDVFSHTSSFIHRIHISDEFCEINAIRKLDYQRFLEYLNSLYVINSSIAKIESYSKTRIKK